MTHPSAASAGVDVGGTFTDVVVHAEGHRPRAVKVPTTPGNQADGVERGVGEGWPDEPLRLLAHGTTTATNAVLERKVARTVLVTTQGFTDVLQIGRQDRPALYDLTVTRPAPLVPHEQVVTVAERTGPDGAAVLDLSDAEVERVVDAVARLRPESVAVSLLFSYAGDAHERRLCAALERLDVPVTRSSALLPEFREYERASTCVLNAAVEPVMRRYLSNLTGRMRGPTVTVMTSSGGTVGTGFAAAAPVHTLLSGPAAGVVAAGAVARTAGFADAIAFDMGGTSTDVCLVRDGRPEVSTSAEMAGLPFRTPAVGIHTVGAHGVLAVVRATMARVLRSQHRARGRPGRVGAGGLRRGRAAARDRAGPRARLHGGGGAARPGRAERARAAAGAGPRRGVAHRDGRRRRRPDRGVARPGGRGARRAVRAGRHRPDRARPRGRRPVRRAVARVARARRRGRRRGRAAAPGARTGLRLRDARRGRPRAHAGPHPPARPDRRLRRAPPRPARRLRRQPRPPRRRRWRGARLDAGQCDRHRDGGHPHPAGAGRRRRRRARRRRPADRGQPRTPGERLGDLRAQFAANHVGATRLGELADRTGPRALAEAMAAVCAYSDRRVRAAVRDIPDGRYRHEDVLEIGHGVVIRAAVTVDGDEVGIDFAGTDPQVPVNLNAVFAVTLSSAMFVFRMLTDPDAPPNAGCYRALHVSAPEGSVVHPRLSAPTAAGNVETSQRIVDVLLGAFAQSVPDRVPAAGQGTMNNLLIGAGGDAPFSYFETLGGGDGLVREIEALADCTLTLQTERREHAPWGAAGGNAGALGRNVLVHRDGTEEDLPGKGTWPLRRGDRVRVETPGGGGWGEADRP